MKRCLIALIFPIILGGCASSSDQDAAALAVITDNATLTRYYWQLQDAKNKEGERITALFVQPEKPVQITFENGNFSVGNTCNNMSGIYSLLHENQLTFGEAISTKKMCAESAVAALDDEVSRRLRGNNRYSILLAEQPVLTLTTANDDVLRFTSIPTPATRYGSEGEIVFMEIAPQTVPCDQPATAKQCLQVRQIYYDDDGLKTDSPGSWQDFVQEIEGYRFQPGVRNILRIKRYHIAKPAANAANTAYILDMVVESEIMLPGKTVANQR